MKSNNPKVIQVGSGPLKKSMLDSNVICEGKFLEIIQNFLKKDCFIVDCAENGIYTWIGRRCTKNEKIASILAAKVN